jgi:hypothetical protein
MKYIRFSGFSLLTAIFLAAGLAGCVKKEFDVPPVYIPTVNFSSNVSIKGLKGMFAGSLMQINADTIIQGIVSANDESGNIYKQLFIQDSTGGILVGIDVTSLYTTYKVGQRILIKCQGLYLGQYGGVTQLGYIYNGAIGRIPSSLVAGHIYLDSLPGKAPVPDTIDVNSAASLPGKISTLVAVKDVRFPDAGSPYVMTGDSYTNRDIADAAGEVIMIDGSSLILRTSQYASFAPSPMPIGKGTLVGILSAYNGQYQMYIRDTTDCVKFDTAGIGPILTTIYEQYFDASPPDWVIYSVASNKNWTWDSQYKVMVGNGYLGEAPSEDWLISPALNLTSVSQPVLTFKTWTQFTDGGIANPLEVFISTDYSGSGNPTVATWTPLTCTLSPANSKVWTSSGDIDLSMYHQKVYIGYKYRSSGTTASTASKWEVDTFKLTGYQ